MGSSPDTYGNDRDRYYQNYLSSGLPNCFISIFTLSTIGINLYIRAIDRQQRT
ncbi:MAG: hypothetical protein SAL07_13415 [Oscillatoria sp. PMC 1051.18]|nr:hypothetical protein [Oscillatoria sp. PMC 1050.18]MEC5030892.1 hypothetical protein [Oscillatoria sp. PMC 1051.18]